MELFFFNAFKDLEAGGKNLHEKIEKKYDEKWLDKNLPREQLEGVWSERMVRKFRTKFSCVVIDEIDTLFPKKVMEWTHNQNYIDSDGERVVYDLFQVTKQCKLPIIVIANTLDLFWRVLQNLNTKGFHFQECPFREYSMDDYKNIISYRFKMLGGGHALDEKALQLMALKASNREGDLRKIFAACRYAIDESKDGTVSIGDLNAAMMKGEWGNKHRSLELNKN